MGMEPANDPNGANPRGHYAGSREEATEELEIEIDASKDVEPPQTAPSPELPSAKVVEEHRHLHIPYRDWCKFCVLGQGPPPTDAVDPRGSRESASTTSTSRPVV